MFKINDRVYDIILKRVGTVRLSAIDYYSIEVHWDNEDGLQSFSCYTIEGKYHIQDKTIRLYHLGDKVVVLYIPQKEVKKVKAYKWVVKGIGGYAVTTHYYRDGRVELQHDNPICRIDDSMIEVDE
jgi:hypothetical protein